MVFKRKEKPRPKAGRPEAIIDWEQVGKWITMGAYTTDIANSLGICRETLYIRCSRDLKLDFSTWAQEKRSKGNIHYSIASYDEAINQRNTKMLLHGCQIRLHEYPIAPEQLESEEGNPKATMLHAQMAQIKAYQSPPSSPSENSISNKISSDNQS